jgi:hypothetical protein
MSETLDQLRDKYGSGRTCTKCGRPKPRMDSSPCFACVLDNVAESQRIVAEAQRIVAEASLPQPQVKGDAK